MCFGVQTTLPLKVPGPNHPSLGLVPSLKVFLTVPALCVLMSFQLGSKI